MSMPSPNLNESEPSCSPHQTANVENGPLYAIVYDPLEHEIFFEKLQDLNKVYKSFPVYLPRWSNRVDFYVDEDKSGFVASIHLGLLEWRKNWARHLGMNYTVLHVKGTKPDTPLRVDSDPSACTTSD